MIVACIRSAGRGIGASRGIVSSSASLGIPRRPGSRTPHGAARSTRGRDRAGEQRRRPVSPVSIPPAPNRGIVGIDSSTPPSNAMPDAAPANRPPCRQRDPFDSCRPQQEDRCPQERRDQKTAIAILIAIRIRSFSMPRWARLMLDSPRL